MVLDDNVGISILTRLEREWGVLRIGQYGPLQILHQTFNPNLPPVETDKFCLDYYKLG